MDRDHQSDSEQSHDRSLPGDNLLGPLEAVPQPVAYAARLYREAGYAVIPVPHGSKEAVIAGWQKLRLRDEQLASYFRDPTNIAVLPGEASGWVVDVDLDCEEAVRLAPSYLPPTDCKSGRALRPDSHWWYRSEGTATKKFPDPKTRKMIVELRADGCQTVVGPSLHPSGDTYAWLVGTPTEVDPAELRDAVSRLHEAVLLERYGEVPKKRSAPVSTSAPLGDPSTGSRHAVTRASKYLSKIDGAISGQGGHNQTFSAARALVHGFLLDEQTALDMLLNEYNPRCVPAWTEPELRHKVKDAAAKPFDKPPGWLLNAPESERSSAGASRPPTSADYPADGEGEPGLVPLGTRDAASGKLVLAPRRTVPTARAFTHEFYRHPDRETLISYAGVLMEWRDNHYREIEDGAVKAQLAPWLHRALRYVRIRSGEFELCPFDSNPTTVNQALETLRSRAFLSALTPSPCWLDELPERPPAWELLPCKSLTLHIPTRKVLMPTPSLFTVNALDFDYDADAPPPTRWLAFLDQVFGDDREALELLQEMMGYLLTGDTRQQKMFLLVGPKRSGKGTIARVIARLVGAANVAGPTTSSLAETFGLQPLIGKSVALVSDARFSGDKMSVVIERLLCISGEDSIDIHRKYLDAVHMKLPTRFVFLTNELPRLNDASTALPSRFLILRFTRSFFGKEDLNLTAKLVEELPGILLWAIDGWKRLHERGRFVQPKSGLEAAQELEDLASPVGAFVRERCIVGPGHRVSVDDLYHAWEKWCEEEGRQHVTTKKTFGRDLGAAVPGIECRRGTTQRFYQGIAVMLDVPV